MQKERVQLINEFLEYNHLSALILYRPEELLMSLGYHPHIGLSIGVFYKNHSPILYVSEYEPIDLILDDKPEVKKISWKFGTNGMEALLETIKADIEKYGDNALPVGLVKNASQVSITGTVAEGSPLSNDWLNKFETITSAGFVDVSDDIQNMYAYKTPKDIEHIEKVFDVAKEGIKAFYSNLKAGNSEIYLKAKIEYAINLQGERGDVFMSYGFAQVQAGDNTKMSGRYNLATKNVLKDGDLVLLELAVCVNGYWCDITRTGYVGTPTKTVEEQYRVIEKAQQSAISKLQAGVTFSQIYHEAMEVIKQAGYEKNFTHALGHGVGFRYHDYNSPIVPDHNDVLKEGMVVTIEPGIYGDEIKGGIRIEDNVLILKDGYKILSSSLRSGLTG